jgi:hypothetical protein
LLKALSALQEAPQDGGIYSRSSGKWVQAGVVTKGDSAYQVAVKNGYQGSERQWLESLRGEDILTLLKEDGTIPLYWTVNDWNNSLKGPAGASYGIQRTLYYEITANQSPNLRTLDLSQDDLLGNSLVLDSALHDESSIFVTYNGVFLQAGSAGDNKRDWFLDIANNWLLFTEDLQPGRLVTLTYLTPASEYIEESDSISNVFGGWFSPTANQGGTSQEIQFPVVDGSTNWKQGAYVIAVTEGIYNFNTGLPAGTLNARTFFVNVGDIVRYDGAEWVLVVPENMESTIISVEDANGRLSLNPKTTKKGQLVYQKDDGSLWSFEPQTEFPNISQQEDWVRFVLNKRERVQWKPGVVIDPPVEFDWEHNPSDVDVFRNGQKLIQISAAETPSGFNPTFQATGSKLIFTEPVGPDDVFDIITVF